MKLAELSPGALFRFLPTQTTPATQNLTRTQEDAFNEVLRVHEVVAGGMVIVSRLEDGAPAVLYWGEMAVSPVRGVRWD